MLLAQTASLPQPVPPHKGKEAEGRRKRHSERLELPQASVSPTAGPRGRRPGHGGEVVQIGGGGSPAQERARHVNGDQFDHGDQAVPRRRGPGCRRKAARAGKSILTARDGLRAAAGTENGGAYARAGQRMGRQGGPHLEWKAVPCVVLLLYVSMLNY